MLWTIVIGLVAGVLAKLLMPGKDPGGIIITILLGIAGSLVANFLGSLVGFYQQGERAGESDGGQVDHQLNNPNRLPRSAPNKQSPRPRWRQPG